MTEPISQITAGALDYELKKKMNLLKLKQEITDENTELVDLVVPDLVNKVEVSPINKINLDPKIEACEISSDNKEKYISDKQIAQLINIFTKNQIINNEHTVEFVDQILHELPVNLLNDLYAMYQAKEIIDLKYKK